MKIEYLLFNVFILVGPLLAQLCYPKAAVLNWKKAILAVAAIALPFILLDLVVTNHWWYFNDRFILGWKLAAVPLEELFFFLTVPFACLVLWVNGKRFFLGYFNAQVIGAVSLLLSVVLAGWAVMHSAWYTLTMAAGVGCGSLLVKWQRLAKAQAVLTVMVLVLTLVFNTYLTARPIVTYNPAMITNLRLGTVPVEDFLYGLILILSVVWVYERLNKAGKPSEIQKKHI